MEKSKVFQLLNTLTKGEFDKFESYLNSKLVAGSESLLSLFDCFKLYFSDKKKHSINRKDIENRLFTKEKEATRERKLNYLCSDLVKTIEDFLVHQEILKQTNLKNKLLLKVYKSRKLDDFFFKITSKNRIEEVKKASASNNVNIQTASDYQKYLIFQDAFVFHPMTDMIKADVEEELKKLDDYVTKNYYASKLIYGLEIVTRKRVMNEDFDTTSLEVILKIVEEAKFYSNDFFQMLWLGIDMMKNNNHVAYQKLSNLFKKNYSYLSHRPKRILLQQLINFAGLSLNSSSFEYNNKMKTDIDDWYELGFVNNILNEDKRIATHNFVNIIDLKIALAQTSDEIDKVFQFLERNVKYIDKTYRNSIKKFTIASIHFKQKEYNKVAAISPTYKLEDFYMGIKARVLYLKTYYELWKSEDNTFDTSFIETYCDSFTRFLNRKKEIDGKETKKANKNFVKIVKRLVLVDYDSKTLEHIHKILDNEEVANRTWIIEKINAL